LALPTDKHFTARIIERKDLSEDLWLIRVDPGSPFAFKAGQYATLGVDHEDKRIERAYSIVSSPYEESLEFFIELVRRIFTNSKSATACSAEKSPRAALLST
jgi:ferredoxin-NADP reductase